MDAQAIFKATLEAVLSEMSLELPEKVTIEPSKNPEHGELASNIALLLTKVAKMPPMDLAKTLAEKILAKCPDIAKAEAAKPGFLNVTFKPEFWHQVITEIENTADNYGSSNIGANKKVLVEYVSANPTGPLHIGHGRGAAVGDSLTRLLRFTGFKVETEYYLNDTGNQMRKLGSSVFARVLQSANKWKGNEEDIDYKGEYIKEIAADICKSNPEILDWAEDLACVYCQNYAITKIMAGIKQDLHNFQVEHQNWFSEKSLHDSGAILKSLDFLKERGWLYEQDGAIFIATSKAGDDKDRVVKRSTDETFTYFAADIAYHQNKCARGYDLLVNILGTDHHGYVPRMKAVIEALGQDPKCLNFILIHLVNLLRNGETVSMSTRAGTFDTLADVVQEVGVDATRYMFLSRKSDSPLDFDLELVKQRNMDNPVYYLQYAYARICAVLRRAAEREIEIAQNTPKENLALLDTAEDLQLLQKVAYFPTVLQLAAQNLAIHHVSYYLLELATAIHSYYAKYQILLSDDLERTKARLGLMRALSQVLANGLNLLGVSTPETM